MYITLDLKYYRAFLSSTMIKIKYLKAIVLTYNHLSSIKVDVKTYKNQSPQSCKVEYEYMNLRLVFIAFKKLNTSRNVPCLRAIYGLLFVLG